MMKKALVLILILSSGWDGFTTIYGTIQTIGIGIFQIIAALIFGALILCSLLFTERIFKWQSDLTGAILRLFWFIAVCYDFYTSWLGNRDFIVGYSSSNPKLIVLIGLTFLVSGSPIVLSLLWRELKD
jgi:hypothetical protein